MKITKDSWLNVAIYIAKHSEGVFYTASKKYRENKELLDLFNEAMEIVHSDCDIKDDDLSKKLHNIRNSRFKKMEFFKKSNIETGKWYLLDEYKDIELPLNDNRKSAFTSEPKHYTESQNQEIITHDTQLANNTNITKTESETIIKARIGQNGFRQDLFKMWNGCSVTGYDNKDMLIASHIKPWAESEPCEQLDVYNGLLLTPNLDKAFDRGYISFDDMGKILISDKLFNPESLGITKDIKIKIKDKNKPYLEYHRNTVYNKKCTK